MRQKRVSLPDSWLVEVLLYVHRNRRFIRDGSPGRPPRLSHSSRALLHDSTEQRYINVFSTSSSLFPTVSVSPPLSPLFIQARRTLLGPVLTKLSRQQHFHGRFKPAHRRQCVCVCARACVRASLSSDVIQPAQPTRLHETPLPSAFAIWQQSAAAVMARRKALALPMPCFPAGTWDHSLSAMIIVVLSSSSSLYFSSRPSASSFGRSPSFPPFKFKSP